ncbi:cation diffusion facilitator family transporter [Leptospira sp. 2 VSF19]|uniref:Cation diffusion facilitator family transporter n=1 Tax=Leptospira soteropolitanensis TaxID=2950025 RepID=A0AAW5VIF2_9LEPT|nr:cation diffusion facilitator family transporter [Leptospira soteropolitanensis]MCW7492053.1 cation diffusion facilitator family transporter [Leptospira soteropolitanensis]MCW7499635.1 cation diffusion facilitator family transporter [Leptospira soteropolitanensis]MCW7521886.1 cation diffusion facilitator family transporter [Leptospira soteropolitanensis]MCW7525740.1 cation diffusion facilitator family transporter [Leptospira soteropolitanensis]MCW7530146.1 cation diffusion facilitator family
MSKPRPKRSRLVFFLSLSGILSIVIFFIEWIGSRESGSLALFADAGHIFTDVFAHIISLFALLVASKRPTEKYPFGFHRFEVLAAFINGLLLIGMAGFILYESYLRFSGTAHVEADSMLAYSLIGFGINLISAGLLVGVSKTSLNLKSAYLHVLSDLLGTLAVIVGALIIRFTGYKEVDSFLSIVLGIFILKTSYGIVKESVEILIEADTSDFDKEHLLDHIQTLKGIVSVPQITVRKLTSGVFSVEIQILVNQGTDRDKIVLEIHKVLKGEFGVPFVSVEILSSSLKEKLEEISVRESEREFGHHGHSHGHAHDHHH